MDETGTQLLATGTRIAGRYRVEAQLARGGAGAVYAVADEASGRRVALKQLLPGARERMRVLFEREYHTLRSLRHPRIIEVYDYGVDGAEPYYTMELLDGNDMRELSPMHYRDACRHLRDVASSLALLHVRRLLHRDLSPRNVRLTGDGRCKLIDFGALTPFGVASEIMGTPPCVPPEAAHGLALDQRADLYALGALAYHMLTGHHAYPVRRIEELFLAWKSSPPKPSRIQPRVDRQGRPLSPLPKALDALVMSLLRPDPLARPASAAGVIDALNAIAELEAEQELPEIESYLVKGALVGREAEVARIERALDRALERRGSALYLEGRAGLGSTRLLEELAVRAQLAGGLVLLLDAEAQRGPYSLARELVHKLVTVNAELALGPALAHAPVLIEAFPELAPHFPGQRPAQRPMNPGMWRAQLQSTLVAWLFALSRRQTLVIVVDGLQHADDASAALLAGLALEAPHYGVLVACGARPGEVSALPPSVRLFREAARDMVLEGLDPDATRALVRSWFGDVPDTDRLAEWLHGLTAGNPGRCVDIARHLVAIGVIQHRAGMWVLPRMLDERELPSGVDEVVAARLARLGPAATALARAASIHPGPVSVEFCRALVEGASLADVFAALDELVAADVLRVAGESYHFAQGMLRERLLASVGDEERRRLHARIGEWLLARGGEDAQLRLDAGWHVLQGGDERRGAELLAEGGLGLVLATDELSVATPALERALEIFRAEGRRPIELLKLLAPITLAGYYSDRRLADRYGEETIALYEKVTGLALARRLRGRLGATLSLGVGLLTGAVRFVFGRGYGGIRGLVQTFVDLGTCVTTLAGVYTICLDAPRVVRLAEALEPLTRFGRRHALTFLHRFCLGLSDLVRGRTARAIDCFRELMVEIERPGWVRQLPDEARPVFYGGTLYALGALEGFLDGPDALLTAEKLENVGVKLYDMAADQVRTNYYACRGDLEQAARYRRRVETHAIRNGSAWQVEVWAPGSLILAYVITHDAMGAKHTWGELERLSQDIPSLELYRVLAHAAYLLQVGDHEEAIAMHEALFRTHAPRTFIGWAPTMGSTAYCLNELGRFEEARRVCQEALKHLDERDLSVPAMNVRVQLQLARAEAGLGDAGTAFARLESLLARHEDGQGPVTLGSIHRAMAEIALGAGDPNRFEHHLGEMERWFRPTRNPALVAQCQEVRARGMRAGVESERPPPLGDAASISSLGSELVSEWHSRLARATGPIERAETALRLIVGQTGARAGYLYLVVGERLRLVAPRHGELPPEDMTQAIERHLGGDLATVTGDTADLPTRVMDVKEAADRAEQGSGERDMQAYQMLWLRPPGRSSATPRAVVCVLPGEQPLLPASEILLEAVASALEEAGDLGPARAP